MYYYFMLNKIQSLFILLPFFQILKHENFPRLFNLIVNSEVELKAQIKCSSQHHSFLYTHESPGYLEKL